MSEMKNNGEAERKVAISNEDIENVRNYALHFGIDLTPELEKSMENFVKNPTYENQMDFKLEICKWMNSSTHESFNYKLWEHPKEAAKDAMFELQFDKDLKEELSSETSHVDSGFDDKTLEREMGPKNS